MSEEVMFINEPSDNVTPGPNVLRDPADVERISRVITCSSQMCRRMIVEYGEAGASKHQTGLSAFVTKAIFAREPQPPFVAAPCNHHGGEIYGGVEV